MFKRLTFTILVSLLALIGHATHLVGGEMFYDHLGGNTYQITLDLYRDCGPGNTNGTGFDVEATIGVFDASGNWIDQVIAAYTGEDIIPVDLNNPCLAVPPDVCIARARYVATFNLPPSAGGYDVSYTRCCRSPSVQNLNDPGSQGITNTVHIPGIANAVNSSPHFNDYPSVALCIGEDMVFDHSALDPDGDQLVYSLVSPYQGGDAIDPQPAPFPPPYLPVVWSAGYSAAFPIDGAPPLAIDAVTGELTIHPTVQGEFAVGVMVQELRNGVVLSETRRDFKFVVVLCDMDIFSAVQEQNDLCSGLTLEFENVSVNGSFWEWDFGDPSSTQDVSDELNPSWTYAAPGTYTITLVANPGWPCADTSTSVFEAHLPLEPSFATPAVQCAGEEMELVALGNFTSAAAVSWDLGPTATPSSATGSVVQTSFSGLGRYPILLSVSENGCDASYVDSVSVFPYPIVDFDSDREACVGEQFDFMNNSSAPTPLHYSWDLGDGGTSFEEAPTYEYPEAGIYTVSLTVSTDSGCIAERTMVKPAQVSVRPKPVAAFSALPPTVSLFDPAIEVEDYASGAVVWSYSIEDNMISDPEFDYLFEEAGVRTILQTVTTEYGCTDTTSRTVFVTDHLFFAPTAFSPNNDGKNDTFAPLVRGAREYELVIYDRWGQEQFRTTDPRGEWSGDGLPQGVFTYTARIAEYGSYSKDYMGHVTLLK